MHFWLTNALITFRGLMNNVLFKYLDSVVVHLDAIVITFSLLSTPKTFTQSIVSFAGV